jgi:hypothetical protein
LDRRQRQDLAAACAGVCCHIKEHPDAPWTGSGAPLTFLSYTQRCRRQETREPDRIIGL